MPHFFDVREINFRNQFYKKLAEYSDIIILSSVDAQNDFKEFIPAHGERGKVLSFAVQPPHNYFDLNELDKRALVKKYKINSKFIYLPNQLWQHKNHKVVIKAIAILKNRGLSIKLICSGSTYDYRRPNFFTEIKNYIEELDISDRVNFLGVIPHEDVYQLIKFLL